MRSCFDVASYFIDLANKTGNTVNNLKLQKLVYYSQAWHLAIHGTPLFEEDFQAWIHGPVIPELKHPGIKLEEIYRRIPLLMQQLKKSG
ncbi:MAG: DUF4065 domain-containing protein [Cyanosarcina radialis HA8281-LM2]|nr:DUF4065 domain-containing protein [Cyanosarcina radialis HA8281-LM2]